MLRTVTCAASTSRKRSSALPCLLICPSRRRSPLESSDGTSPSAQLSSADARRAHRSTRAFRDDCGFHPRGDHLWYFSGPAVVEPAGAICSQGGSDQRLAYFAQVSSLEWPRGGADFTLARSPSLRGTLHPQPSESTAIGSGIRSKSSAAYFLRALAGWLHPRDGCGVRPAGARQALGAS